MNGTFLRFLRSLHHRYTHSLPCDPLSYVYSTEKRDPEALCSGSGGKREKQAKVEALGKAAIPA